MGKHTYTPGQKIEDIFKFPKKKLQQRAKDIMMRIIRGPLEKQRKTDIARKCEGLHRKWYPDAMSVKMLERRFITKIV